MNASAQPSPQPLDLSVAVRRALWVLIGLSVVGLPLTYFVATSVLDAGLVIPAVVCSGWVLGVAILGLLPLWMARHASPAQQINARLGHVMVRLLFTAGGLIAYLLMQPEAQRLPVGLFGLAWYGLTWVVDFGLLRSNHPQAAL